MPYKTKEEAEQRAKELCPEGWSTHVWQNNPWFVCWYNGPLSVHELADHSGFYATICGQDPDLYFPGGYRSGGHALWNRCKTCDTIVEAARDEYDAYMGRFNVLSKVQRELVAILGLAPPAVAFAKSEVDGMLAIVADLAYTLQVQIGAAVPSTTAQKAVVARCFAMLKERTPS